MPVIELTNDGIRPLQRTTFAEAGVKERQDLQRVLRENIEIIAPGTLVVSEEFSEWADARRRIDLLGIDKEANLVVIELKRDEEGGHMDLQAIRYAAMVSTMTFDRIRDVYADHLRSLGSTKDPEQDLLAFLEWSEPDEDRFAQDVRIVLASANFSREVTSTVLWLAEHGLDIRCVRMEPYSAGDRLLLNVEQIIPLPEAAEYQVQIREKSRKEREARKGSRDTTRFDLVAGTKQFKSLPKRSLIYQVIRHLCVDHGIEPEAIDSVLNKTNLWKVADGELGSEAFVEAVAGQMLTEGRQFDEGRYFCGDDQLLRVNGRTYALTNQWGRWTERHIQKLLEEYPDSEVRFAPAAGDSVDG